MSSVVEPVEGKEVEEAPKDLDWFLTHYTVDCPTCLTNTWTFARFKESEEVVALSIISRSQKDRKGYGPVICLVCDNCGYMRLHAREQFFKYTQALRALKGSGE